MPIFPFSFDDEEERRRRMLTPGINGALPEAPMPRSIPMTPMGDPSAVRAPAIRRPSHAEELGEARDVYLKGTPGRAKSALKGAAQEFLSGGGLIGALTGGAYGAIDPRGLREAEFERKIEPRIARGFGLEDQERAQIRQAEENALNDQYKQAQIGELNRRGLPPPAKPPSYGSAPGLGIYNQQTGQVMTPAPAPQPKQPAPHPVWTNQGMVDTSKLSPEELRKLRPYERRRTGGGGGGSSQKEMRSARVDMGQFERLKGEAIRAQQDGDEEMYAAKRNEMEALADRIDALYGDSVEVGESGGWPYIKFRQGGRGQQVEQQQGGQRSRAASYKILRNGGYSDAEANQELDRLGIK